MRGSVCLNEVEGERLVRERGRKAGRTHDYVCTDSKTERPASATTVRYVMSKDTDETEEDESGKRQ